MTSEASNEFEINYDARFRRIREAAAAAIKQLSVFRSAGPLTQEALDAEVARIAQEKLQPYGCDLVVCRRKDGVTRFLIKVQSTGREYDLIKSFFHRDDGSIRQLKTKASIPSPDREEVKPHTDDEQRDREMNLERFWDRF